MTSQTRADAPQGAVFLSYASQDAEVTRKICETMRTAGIEVWFDQSELRGGDAWDKSIRRQIKECALFMPIISASTQARAEGYFRLEWKLAVDRSHLLAEDHPFFFPVAIGDIADATARVPDKFKEVQWTRLGSDEDPKELVRQVARVLAGDHAKEANLGSARSIRGPAAPVNRRRSWASLWIVLAAAVAMVSYAVFKSRRSSVEGVQRPAVSQSRGGNSGSVPAEAGTGPPDSPLSEARLLVLKARALFEAPEVTNRENMLLAEQICDKAVAIDPADAEVWAARAQLSYLMIAYGHDRTSVRTQAMESDAQRALALSPSSYEAQLATAYAFTRRPTRRAEAELLYRSLLKLNPSDRRVLRNYGHLQRYLGHNDEAFALYDRAAAVPGGDPIALADKANAFYFLARLPEAEQAAEQSLKQAPTGRAYLILTLLQLVLHGDVDRARDSLAKVPESTLQQNRGVNIATLVWLWRREPERALDFLKTVPQDFIEDIYFTGPKLVLTGRAQKLAGHDEAATADWTAALQMIESRGTGVDINSMVVRCELLACLGRSVEAGRLLLQIDQDQGTTWRGNDDTAVKLLILLGRNDEAMALLPGLVRAPSGAVIVTGQSLRLDPDYDAIRGDPRFQALIAESAK